MKILRENSYYVYFVSILLGLCIGLVTIYGQKYLPGNWNSLANLGPVWLLPAFFVSSIGNAMYVAILSCMLCLMGEVIGYYVFLSWINQYTFAFDYFTFVWLICAVIGGVIFGTAGYLWRNRAHKYHGVGSALISGVFIADGLTMLLHIDSYRHMIPVPITEILFGLGLIFLLERNKEKMKSYLLLLPVTLCGLLGYAILFYFT